MASFITGMKKVNKYQTQKDMWTKAAIIDESQESFSMEDVKDNNKQLQQKMQKNEKLIRHLQMERTDHESILKLKEQAKKRNVELVGEQKLLTSAGRQLENEVEIKFSASIEQARERMEDLQKEIEDTRQEISALEVEFRKMSEEKSTGGFYFVVDKTILESLIEDGKKELENVTQKLDQLQATRAKRGRIYNSVEEFMAERDIVIDLAIHRGQVLKAKEEEHGKIKKTINELQKTAADLQKNLDRLQRTSR